MSNIPEEYFPQPADKIIPDWYKDLESYLTKEKKPTGNGESASTIKRCMPVFDAMTSGYVIFSPSDVWISQIYIDNNLQETHPNYEWANFNMIEFHDAKQVKGYPKGFEHKIAYPKWMNPWAIKTPPGYSCLFVQPVHRDSKFTILPGIVDTDKYDTPVNFPFILNDIKFEGLIPAGTPIAQVIPFKRDFWEMEFGNEKDIINATNTFLKIRTKFFDGYKNMYRQKKQYK